MANNLKKFTTEAEYTAATLNYPAVSWVTSGDTVYFDKTAPTPVINEKVMIAFDAGGDATPSSIIHLYNPNGTSPSTYFSSITFDDVEVNPISADITASTVSGVWSIVKYGITTNAISDCFSGELGIDSSSAPILEMLIPAQVTSIDVNSMPNNSFANIVIEATTPPALMIGASDVHFEDGGGIYVPDESVNTYKSNGRWSDFVSIIYPISNYSGHLPV